VRMIMIINNKCRESEMFIDLMEIDEDVLVIVRVIILS
jgi:hypothetical protein